MATGISDIDAILAVLKTFYAKEGVQNLLKRNSPVVKAIGDLRVEGKEQAFSAMYSFGGAVSADYTVALANAQNQMKNVEFKVTPGQLFSVYPLNAKEVQASLTRRGAYMKMAGAKMFAASEGLRKMLAAAFYGRGYGELAIIGSAVSLTGGTDATITLPEDVTIKLGVGTRLAFKTSVSSTTESAKATVKSIDGTSVVITPDAGTSYTTNATDIVCFAGSVDSNGPLLPMGLGGWLPIVNGRVDGASDTNWSTYIGTKFFNVTRSADPEALAGAFYDGRNESVTAKQTKKYAIKSLIKKVRRNGSKADMIVLNDDDWSELADEIESTNTYFTQTSTKSSKKASVGFGDISASFSTNFIENIYDDPYCPKGQFYVLDKDSVEFWSYTNTDVKDDGVVANEAGKIMNADADESKGHEDAPYKLLIDDYISVQQGTPTAGGPTSIVGLNLFASYAVWNPSVNGTGIFYGATGLVEAAV